MKIKNDYILRDIAGEHILLQVGDGDDDFLGIMSLNESGVLLWKLLAEGCTEEALINAVLNEYEIDCETAASDVKRFIKTLQEHHLLADDL